jgi:hypothetical protein
MADDVAIDPETKRVDLVDVFNKIEVSPGTTDFTGGFYLFFSATAIRGQQWCELTLTFAETLEEIYRRPVRLDWEDPIGMLDMTVRVNSLPVPYAGMYIWDLAYQGNSLGYSRFFVSHDGD